MAKLTGCCESVFWSGWPERFFHPQNGMNVVISGRTAIRGRRAPEAVEALHEHDGTTEVGGKMDGEHCLACG
jgi:hypothetical protein